MPVYLLCCERRQPASSYAGFEAELDRLEAKPVTSSTWVFRASGPAGGIRDHLKGFLAPDDRLLVVQVDGTEWATRGALTPIKSVLGA